MVMNKEGDESVRVPEILSVLSVVVPAFNEAEVLTRFHERLSAVLKDVTLQAEIVYVNDGSSDATLDVMRTLAANDSRVAIRSEERRVGKECRL